MKMKTDLIKNSFFYLLLTITTVVFIWLLKDFLMPLFWAATFGVLFHPVFKFINRHLREKASLSALLTIVFIFLIVILPAFLVGLAVSKQMTGLYNEYIVNDVSIREIYQYLEKHLPAVTNFLESYGINIDNIKSSFSGAVMTSTRFLASKAYGLGGNILHFFLLFFVMIYLLFFFLRDGNNIIEIFIRALPMGDKKERLLFSKFREVLHATVKGTFVVGIIQGTLGGITFWILGIEAAVLWGVLMIILSLLPVIGSPVIWGPAVIIFFVTGEWVKGIILLLIGSLIISLIDNFLRPILVGRDTKIPDYLILLSTLGGLTLFGISGFIIGPVIASLFLTIWNIFMLDYSDK
ncbi:AI-2E family transporter [candidate division KSB1 bacterium]|nr:AI-2E family transporter [candidate division KSB1 bacterium]